jgi:ABC-type transporter Mla maintaining outer membrane lipid asymmetry ATPase subunit MlaF
MPLLALKGISKKFGAHVVLDGISLEIERGEVVAIVGRSGRIAVLGLAQHGLDQP